MKVRDKVLKPVHPNAGLAALYRRRLDRLIADMQRSYVYWLTACYRKNTPKITLAMDSERSKWATWIEPELVGPMFASDPTEGGDPLLCLDTTPMRPGYWIVMDASPAKELERELRGLGDQWVARFEDAAPKLARYFTRAVERRSTKTLMKILRDAGIAVEFKMTPAMRDVVNATLAENVSLIKSIASQYHSQVEGLVMRSVASGRDLGTLTAELQHRYGVTRRRAALIAKTQNNMATAAMMRVRQGEAGITEAIWLHSHGGREPRPTHLANSGERYNIAEGWFDPDPKVRRHIQPGELINCFPAETLIDAALDVEVAYRHWHRDDLAEIVTASGKTLRATMNHPILTTRGWRPIGLLNVGDDVIEVGDHGTDVTMTKFNKDDGKPTISEVFESVAKEPGSRLEISLGADFHGDVAYGDVDIVFAARKLAFGRKPFSRERLEKIGLAVPDLAASGVGAFAQFLVGPAHSANGRMGSFRQRGSLRGGAVHHPQAHGVTAASDGATDTLDPVRDRFSLMSEPARKHKDAFSSLMPLAKPVRIVRIKRRAFAGHVFNLQTSSGWYVAGGIISHNCRCVSKPIVKGFS